MQKYGHTPGFQKYIVHIKNALYYVLACPHQIVWQITLRDRQELKAHCMIIGDDRLQNNQAFFGFFECSEDSGVFDQLWNEVKRKATLHGFRELTGPVCGTTWHPHSVIKNCRNYTGYPAEPITETYYYPLLRQAGQNREELFRSFTFKDTEALLDATENYHEYLSKRGFRFTSAGEINSGLLHKIYILSLTVYRNVPGFVNLSLDEFISLYSNGPQGMYRGKVFLALKGEDIYGYCSIIPENQQILILNPGIHPALVGLGLGMALLHHIVARATPDEVEELIQAPALINPWLELEEHGDPGCIREFVCFRFQIY